MSYQDTVSSIISSGKLLNTTCTDSLSVRQDNATCTFKSLNAVGDDYWIIQYYKMSKISDVSVQEVTY